MRLFVLARWLLTLLAGLGAMLVGPGVANACACGAAIADELTPVRETAAITSLTTWVVRVSLATRSR